MRKILFAVFVAFSALFVAAMVYIIFFSDSVTLPTPSGLPSDTDVEPVSVSDETLNSELQRSEEAAYEAATNDEEAEDAETLRKEKIEDAWEKALASIEALSEKGTVPGKSDIKRFKEAFDGLDEDDKLMQINHANVIISDEASDCLAAILFDPAESEDVLSAILFSFANRDDSVGLPVLKKVADDPEHPLADTAREILSDR